MTLQLHYWVYTPKITDVVKRKATCTPMFIAAMATVAKLWKEPRCPSADEWIKKMWSIYTMEYYASIQKGRISNFCINMDGAGGDYAV